MSDACGCSDDKPETAAEEAEEAVGFWQINEIRAAAIAGVMLLTAWILPLWSEAGRQQAPIWAAIYHQIGSLAVLLNAMRLLWFERQAPAGGWWQRLRQGSQAVDDWIDRFRLHDLLHRLEERWRTTLAGNYWRLKMKRKYLKLKL